MRAAVERSLLTAMAVCGVLSACSPKWANGVAPQVAPGAAPDRASPSAEPQDPLQRYVETPLGSRVRAKRIRVLLVSVGDIAVYRHTPTEGAPTFTSVLRSYTSFKDNSLEGLDEFMDEVRAAYDHRPGEIEDVRRFIREAVKNVEYYRVDVRHTPAAEQGAVLVYEFVEDGPDRLLDSRLITAQSALAVIHYTDSDGWDIAPDQTLLAPHYDTFSVGEKLTVKVKQR